MNDKNEESIEPELIPPDLKHDTMEYAASADGGELFDIDYEAEVTAAELEDLEQSNPEDNGEALNAVLHDSETDTENFFKAPEESDEFEEDKNDDLKI